MSVEKGNITFRFSSKNQSTPKEHCTTFSLLYLDWPSTGAEVGKCERFVFLFLAFVCWTFCFS